MSLKEYFQNKRLPILFALIGGIGGFLYWKFVGCESGTCAIKSVWYWTTLWGTAVGYLVGDLIGDFLNKRNKRKEKESGREISEHN